MDKVLKMLMGLLMLGGMAACNTEVDLPVDDGDENLMQVPMFSRAALAPTATIVGLDGQGKTQFEWGLTDPEPDVDDNFWTSSQASPSLNGVSTVACLVPSTDVQDDGTVDILPKENDVLQWGKVAVTDKAADNRFYINLDYKLATICVQVDKKIQNLEVRYYTMGTFDVESGEFTDVKLRDYEGIGSKLQKDGEYYVYSFSVVPQTFEKNDILLRYTTDLDAYRTRTYRFKADQDYVLEAGQTLHIHAYADDDRWSYTTSNSYVAVTGVTINSGDFTLNKGNNKQLTATVSPSYASEPGVTWSSNNTSVATVDQTGKVTAVGRGTATITVTTGNGKTDTVTVTVKDPAKNITFVPEDGLEVEVGETKQINATLDTTDVIDSYESSDTDVAEVDDKGNVTGKKPGGVTITITTEDGATFTYEVVVPTTIGDWGDGGSGNGELIPVL